MRTTHYKLMTIGQHGRSQVLATLPALKYEPGNQRGFLLAGQVGPNRVRGKYVYTRLGSKVALDPETLQPKAEAITELVDVLFELDFQKGLVSVQGARNGLNALYEALDAVPGAACDFEDLNLNLCELMFETQRAYKKNVIKGLKIRDYLARENMLGNPSFKILEPQDGEKIAEKFSDQLEAFTLTLKLPDGAVSLSVTRKGTVKASDDAPDGLLMFVKDLLPRFHESEVETTEVVEPSPRKDPWPLDMRKE